MNAAPLWKLMSDLFKNLPLSIFAFLAFLFPFTKINAQDKSVLDENVYMNTSFLDSIQKYQSCAEFADYHPLFFGYKFSKQCTQLNAFTKHEGGIVCNLEFIPHSLEFSSSNDSDYKLNGTILPSDAVLLNAENDTTFYSPYPSIETAIRQQFFCGNFNDLMNVKYAFNPWNGHVSGFGPEYHYYTIIYDFSLGIDFDCIALYSKKDSGNWNDAQFYHFNVLNATTLELYKVTTDFVDFNHEISIHPIILKKIN